MNRYNVGDVVEFTEENGSYIGIKNHGVIEEVLEKGYNVICCSLRDNSVSRLYFFNDEIAGLKKGE